MFCDNRERKTRLELATPTLARLCSTNWAISANWKWRGGDSNSHASRHCHLKAARLPFRHLSIPSSQSVWCPRQESNLHAFRHTHLKRARLPIPPLGQTLSGKRGSNSRPQPWQGCALPTELFPHLVFCCALRFSLSIASFRMAFPLNCGAKVWLFFEWCKSFKEKMLK